MTVSPDTPAVRVGYGTLEELFQTEIINIGLERLGYKVIPGTEIEYEIIHRAIADQHLDYTASHWHILHDELMEPNEVERVGVLIEEARQGYLIDRKTAEKHGIEYLEDLRNPGIAELFDYDDNGKANLIGCNLGWQCHRFIDYHISEEGYGLQETVEQDFSNYYAEIEEMKQRFEQGKPILYYTWQPFELTVDLKNKTDVIWLKVKEVKQPPFSSPGLEINSDGSRPGFPDQIGVLANREFLESNPLARNFFEQVKLSTEEIEEQNQFMRRDDGRINTDEIRQQAEAWVEDNEEKFENWLKQAQKQAQKETQSANLN
jgi:glycine betaine/proline transport system substrate-binding protein